MMPRHLNLGIITVIVMLFAVMVPAFADDSAFLKFFQPYNGNINYSVGSISNGQYHLHNFEALVTFPHTIVWYNDLPNDVVLSSNFFGNVTVKSNESFSYQFNQSAVYHIRVGNISNDTITFKHTVVPGCDINSGTCQLAASEYQPKTDNSTISFEFSNSTSTISFSESNGTNPNSALFTQVQQIENSPAWLKKVFQWYDDGQLSDNDMLVMIKYLIAVGIIHS